MSFGIVTSGTGKQVIEDVRIAADNYVEGNSQLESLYDYLVSELGEDNEYIVKTSGHKDSWSHYVNLEIQKFNRPKKINSDK